MKVYYIVGLMVLTLIVLFILLPKFRNREVINNKLEINYFEKLKDAKKSGQNIDILFKSLKSLLVEVYNSNDDSFLLSKLESDLAALGESK